MFDFAPTESEPNNNHPQWTAERFAAALHPAESRGAVSLLISAGETMFSRTYRPGDLGGIVAPVCEHGGDVYLAINRYHGPRGAGRPLAALNALFVDLDIYNIPVLAALPRADLIAHIQQRVRDAGIPDPSFLVDSGRGFYCIWLLTGVAPGAIERWSAVERALVDWGQPLGADPKCVDVARVLRLPGSWHPGIDRQVRVIAGNGDRHDFDTLADCIWLATGRPERADLKRRKMRMHKWPLR